MITNNIYTKGSDLNIFWTVGLVGSVTLNACDKIQMAVVTPVGRRVAIEPKVSAGSVSGIFHASNQKQTGWYGLQLTIVANGKKTVLSHDEVFRLDACGGNNSNRVLGINDSGVAVHGLQSQPFMEAVAGNDGVDIILT